MSKLDETFKKIINWINFNDDQLNYGCCSNFCDKENFTDYRYKCLICYDYDLCGNCFEERKFNSKHEICHPMHRFGIFKINISF